MNSCHRKTTIRKRWRKQMKISLKEVQEKVAMLHEMNPMLGHRGCRLGITYPEIYDMQARAIIEAACNLRKERGLVLVFRKSCCPLSARNRNFVLLKDRIHAVARRVMEEKDIQVDYKVGTMIELPRAALIADKIAKHAEFFSFGTNDLTQMTFGFSREDVGSFVPEYLEKVILRKTRFKY